MYGDGRAETVLGGFVPAVRSEITLVSKVGIRPPPMGIWPRAWSAAFRRTEVLAPAAARLMPRPPSRRPVFGCFSLAEMRASLLASLRALRTDHLDLLLLHECPPELAASDDVERFRDETLASGQTRSFGIACTPAQTEAILARGPEGLSVVQVASTPFDDILGRLPDRGRYRTITHGALKVLKPVLRLLEADAAARRAWTDAVDTDPLDPRAVSGLLLAEALAANRDGVVLFSSSRPENIRASMAVERDRPFTEAQIEGVRRFAAVVRGTLASG